jgi:hypothetical protein
LRLSRGRGEIKAFTWAEYPGLLIAARRQLTKGLFGQEAEVVLSPTGDYAPPEFQATVSSHVAVTGTACLSEPSKDVASARQENLVSFHDFARCHRLMAVAVAASVVSMMTSAGCGTAASRASGPVTGGPRVIVVSALTVFPWGALA